MSKIVNVCIGNDIGNSEHDIIINGKLIRQPNVFSKVRELPNLEELKVDKVISKIEDNLITTISSEAVPAGTYYVGKYALSSGQRVQNMEVGLLNDKANADVVIINTVSQIAGYAAAQVYKENHELSNEEPIKVYADMTVAIPVTQYSKKTAELLKSRYMKKHKVDVHVSDKRIEVEVYFDYVKVLPESIPAVFYLQKASGSIFTNFNKLYKLNVTGDYFKNKRILHVAIGEGTTETPLTMDISFDPNFIKGSDNGVGLAIDKAIQPFTRTVGLRTFTRQNYSALLRDTTHKYYSQALDFIEDPLEEESEAILHNTKAEVERANNEVDIILVHGGGSILMRPHLEKKLLALCEKAKIQLFYVDEQYAVILEALGMYEFSKSDIFANLKYNAISKKPLEFIEEKTIFENSLAEDEAAATTI